MFICSILTVNDFANSRVAEAGTDESSNHRCSILADVRDGGVGANVTPASQQHTNNQLLMFHRVFIWFQSA